MTVKKNDIGDSKAVTSVIADEGMGIVRRGEKCVVEVRQIDIPHEVDEKELAEFIELPLGLDYSGTKYSTLSIKRELDKLIREDGMSAWKRAKGLLQDAEYWDDFILANYLSEQDNVFKTACGAIVERGIVTQEELDALLPKCIWTAE